MQLKEKKEKGRKEDTFTKRNQLKAQIKVKRSITILIPPNIS